MRPATLPVPRRARHTAPAAPLRAGRECEVAAAARRAAAAWADGPEAAAFRADPAPPLRALADAVVRRRRAGDVPELGGFDPVLLRRLLDLLRAELVRGWADAPPAAAAMLETLQALEAVRESLDPTWGEHLASRLATPGGSGLIREVAHDLQSPLTSILFLSETLRRGQSGEVNPLQKRQLGIIYSASLGLMSMANSLIELLGNDHAPGRDAPTPFSVDDVLAQVADLAGPVADEKGLALRVHRPRDGMRLGHPAELTRVLVNLTTNALKFTEAGFVEIAVTRVGENRMEFSVRDTGAGIAPEAAEGSCAQPGRTPPGRHFAFSGSGLGLAICRKLVRAMGATLHCETVPRWGTRFYFEVELAPAALEQPSAC